MGTPGGCSTAPARAPLRQLNHGRAVIAIAILRCEGLDKNVPGEVLAQGAAKRSCAHTMHQSHRRQVGEDRFVQEAVQPVQRVGHAHAPKVEVAFGGAADYRRPDGCGCCGLGNGGLNPPLDFVKGRP